MKTNKKIALATLFLASILFVFTVNYLHNSPNTISPKKASDYQNLNTTIQSNSKIIPFNSHKLQQLFIRGDEEYKKGNTTQAINLYRKILSKNPAIVEALIRLGRAFAKQDKHNLAINEYKAALSINPVHVEAHLLLSRSLRAQKNLHQATAIIQKVLRLNHKHHAPYIELAKIYLDQKQYTKALTAIDDADHLRPNNVHIYLLRGHILNWKGDIEAAINMYEKAIRLDPTCSNAYYNLGHTLKVYGKFNEAITILHKAAELDPNHVDTHVALAHAYWAIGKFNKAWKEYEWRWQQYKNDPRNKMIPEWHGQNISGKTILLYSEQGLGDTLQFIRFAQDLKQHGATVWCKVQKPLIALLSQCCYIDHIVTDKSNLNSVDYQAPLMSMPGKLHLTPETIPAPKQYLYADKDLVANWSKKLSFDSKYKIGVCWQVSEQHEIHKLPIQQRSFPLQELLPLSQDKNISLYCLQLLDEKIRSEIPQGMKIHIFEQDFDKTHGNFMDSAAVIANLDLVISADTVIAHLAAGLGKEVWMILPYSSDCRWHLKPDRSPWYPTMKIFRQSNPGNWHVVIEKIINAIKTEKTVES